MLVNNKLTHSNRTNIVSNNKVNNVLFRTMKNSLEAVAKEGKKVAEKVITTQASNVQATTSNQNQGKILPSLNSPEKFEPTVYPKQSTPFDNYKPLQPQESLKDKINTNEKNKSLFKKSKGSSSTKKVTNEDDQEFMTTQQVSSISITKVPAEYAVIRAAVDVSTTKPSVIQEHMLIAVEKEGHAEAFAIATSSKGNTPTEQNTTTKLSSYKIDNSFTPKSNTTEVVDSFGDRHPPKNVPVTDDFGYQEPSQTSGGQRAALFAEIYVLQKEDYTKHKEGTDFINQPHVKPIVDDMYLQSVSNFCIAYKTTGDTPEEEVIDFYNTIINKNDEVKSIF